jgi:formylglycine-generating enzyme required for sulfatase activity/energy-coupling factor transporter ATP-binding protein EcfA2
MSFLTRRERVPRKVFISYRVADTRPTAGRLAADLRRTFGDEAVFLDYRSLDAAGQWPEQLQTEVASADVVLVLIGKGWLTAQDQYGRRRIDVPDDWVRQEVAAGLHEDGEVLPLLVNDTKPIPAAAIENLPDIAALATTQARCLRDVDWEADFAGLVDWLETQGFERPVRPVAEGDAAKLAAHEVWHGNPYRGLSPFGPEDDAIYYGREREADELLRRVTAERVVAVIGPSGSGKSSLVAAGLLPQLSEDWVWVRFTPGQAGDDPLRALARRLAPHLSVATSTDALAERLRSVPTAIDAVAAETLADRPAGAQLLLFADQFEELFTARVAEAHRAAFVDVVAAVAGSARTRLVLTLRADYTEHCTRYETLTIHLRAGIFLLGTPGVTALKAMVERPARAAGLEVESALVDRILDEAGTEPGALALVEFTLEQLYDARVDRSLTLAAYQKLGGVRGAIEVQGEHAVRDVSGQVAEAALGNVFRALAAVDEHGGAVRKRGPLMALDAGEREIVDRLVAARLLVTDTDAEGAATVEVAHEAVLRHWQRFQRWLDDNRALELWRQRLHTFADSGAPIPIGGGQLATALEWLRMRAADITESERAYILRSRQAARWFYGWVTAGVTTVLLIVGAVALFTMWTAKVGLSTEAGLTALAFRVGLSGLTDFPEPEMVDIPGGTFEMGSPGDEKGHDLHEGPQRMVTVAPFRISKTEVTFALYDVFVKATSHDTPGDHGWGRGSRPAINVNWRDAQDYVGWLSLMTGRVYRLPSESEWEYAARGGTKTAYWWGNGIQQDGKVWANCVACGSDLYDMQTAPVGSFEANSFGLHDMHGNVHEWTEDCWNEGYLEAPCDGSAWTDGNCSSRVVRGGGWFSRPQGLRAAARRYEDPDERSSFVGFRVVEDP